MQIGPAHPQTSPLGARFAFAALLAGNAALAFGPWLVRLADTGPIAAGFWRLALAVPFLLLLARATGQGWPRDIRWPLIAGVALGGWFFAADLGAWHLGIHLTKLANATLFANLSSFAFAAYGFWLARRLPGRVQTIALALAGVGVALLMGGSYELSPRYLRGDLLCLAAGVLYTGYLVAVDRARGVMAPLPLLALASIAAAPPLLAAALIAGEAVVPSDWTPVVLLAIGSQVVGQGLLVFAMGHLSPAIVGLGLLTQPATAALIGWLVYGERMTALDGVGALAIGAALVLIRAREPPRS
ncbi:MAG TPA: DMT family transporter [Sphingomonadaceae bacterium]|nr:DMT family transporter [Sphingomonadaceae bacterium]